MDATTATAPARHSPGPWTREPGQRFRHDESAGVKDATGIYCACALDRNRTDRDAEVEANARLIAAAPELLAACEALLIATDQLSETVVVEPLASAEAAARAAIAKAKGQA